MSSPNLLQQAIEHLQAGRVAQSENLCREILAQQPHHDDALHLLGVIASQCGHHSTGVSLMQRSIALNPTRADYHNNLGFAFESQRRIDDAIASYRNALAIQPEFVNAYVNLGNSLREIGLIDEAIDAYRRAVDLRPDYVDAHSNLVYALPLHPGYNAQAIFAEARRWSQRHAAPLRSDVRYDNDASPARRLRIGYVSPNLSAHPVGRFLLPLLREHDRQAFEVFCYSSGGRADDVATALRASCDVWREVAAASDEQLSNLIHADRIDILIDLNMHMAQSRLLVFARKPAPIQVTYLAYCGTTGLDTIDYRLSDAYLDPPGEDQSVYSETTVRLRSYWCYTPPTEAPAVKELPAAATGYVTFCCLNNFCKVSDPALAAWRAILQAQEGSRLVLHAPHGSARERVRAFFAEGGIDDGRIDFIDVLPALQYFKAYHGVDIALDPFPHGGGTTTCDALWMGVPVITLAGKTAVGRGGVSILNQIGLSDHVTTSERQYVKVALQLARDLPRLAGLRSSLRQRMLASPLMDAAGFARDFESKLRQLWQTWCAERSAIK